MKVVAAENRKQEHHTESVALFFSLALGLPIVACVLVWVSVHGAFPYIRSHINDSDIFPSVAALYSIGQTFSLFVIFMDIIALLQNLAVDEYDRLEGYQLAFISLVTVFEIFGLFLSVLLAFVPLFSHFKHTNCKIIFQGYFKVIFCGGLSFKKVGRKEARVWLLLSSLITPVMAALSHAGFIIGGWVSYKDRSFAVSLLYLFLFVFLYWSLQYIYKFATFVNIRRSLCIKRDRSKQHSNERVTPEINNDEVDLVNENENETEAGHHEEDMAANNQTIKQTGFDTIALFLMLSLLIFLYGSIFYFGFGFVIPLLSSIDKALVHIFALGQYGIAITIFLLTYKLFTIKSGAGQLLPNDALRYWRYLNKGCQYKYPLLALYRAIELLHLTLKLINHCESERGVYKVLLARKKFDINVICDRLDKAINRFKEIEEPNDLGDNNDEVLTHHRQTVRLSNSQVVSLRAASERLNVGVEKVNLEAVEREIQALKSLVEDFKKRRSLSRREQKAVKKLREGINHFRKTLAHVLGVPPMYFNSDKASALTAALVYQTINMSRQKMYAAPEIQPALTQCTLQEHPVHPGQPTQPECSQSAVEPTQASYPGIQQQPTEPGRQPNFEDNERYLLLLSLIEEEF